MSFQQTPLKNFNFNDINYQIYAYYPYFRDILSIIYSNPISIIIGGGILNTSIYFTIRNTQAYRVWKLKNFIQSQKIMNLNSPDLPYIFKHQNIFNKLQKQLYDNEVRKDVIYLIEGYQGCGKTHFAQSFMLDQQKKGRPVAYITCRGFKKKTDLDQLKLIAEQLEYEPYKNLFSSEPPIECYQKLIKELQIALSKCQLSYRWLRIFSLQAFLSCVLSQYHIMIYPLLTSALIGLVFGRKYNQNLTSGELKIKINQFFTKSLEHKKPLLVFDDIQELVLDNQYIKSDLFSKLFIPCRDQNLANILLLSSDFSVVEPIKKLSGMHSRFIAYYFETKDNKDFIKFVYDVIKNIIICSELDDISNDDKRKVNKKLYQIAENFYETYKCDFRSLETHILGQLCKNNENFIYIEDENKRLDEFEKLYEKLKYQHLILYANDIKTAFSSIESVEDTIIAEQLLETIFLYQKIEIDQRNKLQINSIFKLIDRNIVRQSCFNYECFEFHSQKIRSAYPMYKNIQEMLKKRRKEQLEKINER